MSILSLASKAHTTTETTKSLDPVKLVDKLVGDLALEKFNLPKIITEAVKNVFKNENAPEHTEARRIQEEARLREVERQRISEVAKVREIQNMAQDFDSRIASVEQRLKAEINDPKAKDINATYEKLAALARERATAIHVASSRK